MNKFTRKTTTFLLLLSSIALIPVLAVHSGIRLNVSPSAPLGLWLVQSVRNDELVTGEYVLICPPIFDWLRQVAAQARLPHGHCKIGLAPFLKKVAARAGDTYAISGAGIEVNGELIARTQALPAWPLPKATNGTLGADALLVYQNEHPRSLDSRYLGPFVSDNLTMRAKMLWGFGSWPR